MKCPNCGLWNKASLPRCMRCGTPLQPESKTEPAWKSELKDGKGREYIRVDESGEMESAPDSRDQLAQEMAELKQRSQPSARHARRKRPAWFRAFGHDHPHPPQREYLLECGG